DAVTAMHEGDRPHPVLLVAAHLDRLVAGLLEQRRRGAYPGLVLQRLLVDQPALQRRLERLLREAAGGEPLEIGADAVDAIEEVAEAGAGEQPHLLPLDLELEALLDALDQVVAVLAVVLEVARALALAHLVERRLGDVEVAAL